MSAIDKKWRRTFILCLLAPVMVILLAGPSASAWRAQFLGSYSAPANSWQTTIPNQSRPVSGSDSITVNVDDSYCPFYEFHYKRYNTLAPSTTLIRLPWPSTPYCDRYSGKHNLGSQGTVTIFGNFKTSNTTIYSMANYIDG